MQNQTDEHWKILKKEDSAWWIFACINFKIFGNKSWCLIKNKMFGQLCRIFIRLWKWWRALMTYLALEIHRFSSDDGRFCNALCKLDKWFDEVFWPWIEFRHLCWSLIYVKWICYALNRIFCGIDRIFCTSFSIFVRRIDMKNSKINLHIHKPHQLIWVISKNARNLLNRYYTAF